MSDEAQAAYIKKYGEAPGSTGDDDKGDKARATAKSRDKALDKSIWGKEESAKPKYEFAEFYERFKR